MKFVVDMNLSPQWVSLFKNLGYVAVHWSEVGKADATDNEILEWAKENTSVVFTHDLDFGAILAATEANAPSVLQARTQNITPEYLGDFVFKSIEKFRDVLEEGALISIDEVSSRARILPLTKNG